METSSIHLTCPGCAATTLLDRRGSTVRCAACGFDYTAFRQETAAYERFLVECMREGPRGKLGATALHQWTSSGGPAESAASLRDLAARHGVPLAAPMTSDPILRGALIFVAVIVVLVVGSVAWLIVQGAAQTR